MMNLALPLRFDMTIVNLSSEADRKTSGQLIAAVAGKEKFYGFRAVWEKSM